MRRVQILIFLCLVLVAASIFAQNPSAADRTSTGNLPNHGLVLMIAHDSRPDPIGPGEMRKCLAKHPPLACVGFTVTLDNNGNETILFPWVSCPPQDPDVEYKAADGTWKSFPNRPVFICTATFAGLGLIHPGKGSPMWKRLAYMHLDTGLPDAADSSPDPLHPRGYTLLMGPVPLVIRLREKIGNCVVKPGVEEKDLPPPPYAGDSVSRLCDQSKSSGLPIVLVSNELELTTPPVPQ